MSSEKFSIIRNSYLLLFSTISKNNIPNLTWKNDIETEFFKPKNLLSVECGIYVLYLKLIYNRTKKNKIKVTKDKIKVSSFTLFRTLRNNESYLRSIRNRNVL